MSDKHGHINSSDLLGAVLPAVEQHVRELFATHRIPRLVYHNLAHTEAVVAHSLLIAGEGTFDAEDLFILQVAAWFHDTGHLFVEPRRHEEESIQVTSRFFLAYPGVAPAIIAHIERCILSTKMPQVPCTKLEKILCDADTYHFGTEEFMAINELVKEEARRSGWDVNQWNAGTLRLLENHIYHTAFCQSHLHAGKIKNMVLLEATLLR